GGGGGAAIRLDRIAPSVRSAAAAVCRRLGGGCAASFLVAVPAGAARTGNVRTHAAGNRQIFRSPDRLSCRGRHAAQLNLERQIFSWRVSVSWHYGSGSRRRRCRKRGCYARSARANGAGVRRRLLSAVV